MKKRIGRTGRATARKAFAGAVLFLLLSGCVTYYYPVPQVSGYGQPGVTQQAQGHSLNDPLYPYENITLASSAWYPWWSLDYFYLGHGYGRSGWSFGFSYGYPYYDFYYPWYGYPVYNFAWYAPYPHHYHHHHYYGWHQPYWHHRYRSHHFYRGYSYRGYDHHAGLDSRRSGGGHNDRDYRSNDVLALDSDRQHGRRPPQTAEARPGAQAGQSLARNDNPRPLTAASYARSAPETRVISRSRGYASRGAAIEANRGRAPDPGTRPVAGSRPAGSSGPEPRNGTFSVVSTPGYQARPSTTARNGDPVAPPMPVQRVERGSAWVTSMPPTRGTRSGTLSSSPPPAHRQASQASAARTAPAYNLPSPSSNPAGLRPAPAMGYPGGSAMSARAATRGPSHANAGRESRAASRPAATRTRGATFQGNSRD